MALVLVIDATRDNYRILEEGDNFACVSLEKEPNPSDTVGIDIEC
jgi:hypothetical protein